MEPIYLRRDFDQSLTAGFTLIELLMVLAIIITITSVVFTSQSTFNKTLVLTNTAYDVALTLRSVETFGLSSRGSGLSSSAGYGLHIESATPGSFTLFADTSPAPNALNCHGLPASGDVNAPDAKPGNCVYDQSQGEYDPSQGEKVTDYTLGNNITISDFCVSVLNSWSCTYAHDGYNGGLSSLDIVFTRPNPDARMSANGTYSASFPVTKACITITSPYGGSRFISVGSSGQIIANAPSCP